MEIISKKGWCSVMDIEEIEKVKKKYALSEEDFKNMYEEVKETVIGDIKPPQKQPMGILTGGQPGAGKSSIVIMSRIEFENEDRKPVILDGDTYRGLYKNSIKLAKEHPELYSEITDGATGKIMGMLIEDTINGGYDFIREGTLNGATIVDQLLESDKNYNFIIRLMAVCREESLLCVFERYLAMQRIMGMGRFTAIKAHDKRYEQFPKTAREQMNKGVEVEVDERTEDRRHPKMIYKSSSPTNEYASMEEAMNAGRKRSYEKCMQTAKDRLIKIKEDMKELKIDKSEMLQQLQVLDNIINDAIKNYESLDR